MEVTTRTRMGLESIKVTELADGWLRVVIEDDPDPAKAIPTLEIEVARETRVRLRRIGAGARLRDLRALAAALKGRGFDGEAIDAITSPFRRTLAARDYADLLERVRQLVGDAERIEVTATDLEDEALDCQLPRTWGIDALRAWAEGVLP